MSKVKLAMAVALAVGLPSCGDAPLTAPAGSTVQLIANPPFIVANGGVSVVTAIVVEPVGTFVPDGTEVFFFTDLGQIEASRQTKNGVARVNFVSDSRSGQANVTAVSGGPPTGGGEGEGSSTASGTGSATVQIDIGSALPARVLVSADPPGIRSTSSSRLVANVFDEVGNPVASVPVIFSLSGGTTQTPAGVGEYLDSGGSQVFTDTNGQALDTLRSRRPLSDSALITVSATTPNGITGSTAVAIN
jgi:hypothetical protein